MIPFDKSKNTTIDCYLMRDPSLSMKETDLKKIEPQYKYVCKIDGGSVFFCKIPNPVIITSSNILNEEYIIKNKKIFLKLYENKEMVIELDTTRKIYINKLYDTTIIDIKNIQIYISFNIYNLLILISLFITILKCLYIIF